MRLIDADALIAEMSEKHRPNFHEDLKSYHMWIMWYWALKEAPSIDIMRCQDCKYWVYNFNGCARNPCTEPWYATDFCNYGERKESE